ncbi:MAG: DUF5686 and carboxypeptidase regulatory-like domain-containing protein [Prevotella sp.]|jgi:hypothetical protein|nr:DUF5686 and carboxypeptidase regulatory-like domain-containing protein [Prevotella sp.]
MKYILYFTIYIIFTSQLFAQNFKGQIVDKTAAPLYGSSVFIKEINQGLICNEDGYYQTTLAPGNYSVEYRCLGFKTEERKVEISSTGTISVNVTLKENPFMLNEVIVSKGEDPAYPIMRKAIAKAPFYAESAKAYTADVYIKGNAELLKVASLVDKLAKKEEGVKLSEFKNRVFVQESFSEIQFTAPDKYKQTVKAFSSSIPDNLDSKDAMGITRSSLYNPKVGSLISPLNPKAFTYYKFRYEGFSEEGGSVINKIKVEPKLKDPALYEGYIYIAENTWHIHSVKLKANTLSVNWFYNITYQGIVPEVYLPITYITESEINLLGNHVIMNYYASLAYRDIEVNDEIANKLIKKDPNKKRNFEIKKDTLYRVTADSLANKRDSIYWANIRIIPLDKREISGFEKKDSVQQHLDSVRKEHHNPKFSFTDIFTGGRIGNDSGKVVLEYDGLFRGAPEYNFVDGLWLGQKFKVKTKLNKHNRLEVSPYVYYALSRKRLLGGGDISLSYAPRRLGKLEVSAGSVSEDFNPNGIIRFNNATNSLMKGKNYNYYYQKDFISVTNNIDISNGLKLITGFEIARRSGLSNHTDYTWGKRSKISPNIYPDGRFDKTVYYAGINYTPYAYYSVRDGAKRYEKLTSPTFYLRYSEGFSSWQTNNSRYRKIGLAISQNVTLNEFNRFIYQVSGGSFIGNKSNLHFADYQHFNTSNVMINLKSPFTSFMLLDNYSASTGKYWISSMLNYNSNHLLIKRKPYFQRKMFTETLHLKNLYTPDMKLYTEAGYSLNITPLLNVGAFVSFRKAKYQDWGIRLLLDWGTIKRVF